MAGPIPGVAYHLRRDRGTWEAKGRPSLPATGTVATITRADLAEMLRALTTVWRRDCEPCPHTGPVPAPVDWSREPWTW